MTIIERYSQDLTPHDRAQRGLEAERLLEHPVLELAFSMAQIEFVEGWIESDGGQEIARRNHAAIHALGEVKRKLQDIQDDGLMAQHELELEMADEED